MHGSIIDGTRSADSRGSSLLLDLSSVELPVEETSLKFYRRKIEFRDCLVIELSTTRRRSLKPAIHRVPRDSLHASDGRLAHALNAQGRDLVEGQAAMLETIVGCVPHRTERLSACRAAIATASSRSRLVEAVSDDIAAWAHGVRTAGALHFFSIFRR